MFLEAEISKNWIESPTRATRGRGSLREASEIRTLRILGALVLFAYPLFWFANRTAEIELVDPWWARAIVIAVVGGAVAATYARRIERRVLHAVVLATVYAMTVHSYVLMAINDLHYVFTIGSFMILTGFIAISTYAITTTRQLMGYLAFWVGGMAVVAAVADNPSMVPDFALGSILLVAALAYIAVRTQMLTLSELSATSS